MKNFRLFSLLIAKRLPIRVSSFSAFARFSVTVCVTVLTAAIVAGCSTLKLHNEESCNSRAYVRTPLDSFVKQRFPYGAPVRLGIIPFATPESFAYRGEGYPGAGFPDAGQLIARRLQSEFLHNQREVKIVEIIPRSDWPGQLMEIYSGSFQSLKLASDAGYDLVMIGSLDPARSFDELSAKAKLIEVESGMTVWSGEASVSTNRNERVDSLPSRWWNSETNKYPRVNLLLDELSTCLASDALHENPIPE